MKRPEKVANKFLVVNTKIIEAVSSGTSEAFLVSLNRMIDEYEEKTGKKLSNQYVVCNQDESYADKVWEVILKGEEDKARLAEEASAAMAQTTLTDIMSGGEDEHGGDNS